MQLRKVIFGSLMLATGAVAPSAAQTTPSQPEALARVEQLLTEAEKARQSNSIQAQLVAGNRAVLFIEGLPKELQASLPKALHVYGNALFRMGRSAEAVPVHERAIKLNEEARASSLDMSISYEYLASALFDSGRNPEALGAIEKAINPRLAEHIGAPWEVYRLEAQRGFILQKLGQRLLARNHFEFAIQGLRLRPADPGYAILPRTLITFATLQMDLGQPAEAEKLIEEAAAISSKSRNPELLNGANAIAADIQVVRASIAFRKADYRTAIDLVTRAYTSVSSALGPQHPRSLTKLAMIYNYHNEAGMVIMPQQKLDTDLAQLKLGISDEDSRKPEALGIFARALGNQRRMAEAAELFRQALDLDKPFSAQRDQRITPERVILLNNFANIEFELNRFDAAQEWMQQSANGARAIHGKDSLEYAEKLNNLAMIQAASGRNDDAMKNLLLAKPATESYLQPTDPKLAFFHFNIGSLAAEMGETGNAEGHLLKAEKLFATNPRAFGGLYARTLDELVKVSDRLGKREDAAKWRAALEKTKLDRQ
jgi:tetratricopeptide (TPR) repeat protein